MGAYALGALVNFAAEHNLSHADEARARGAITALIQRVEDGRADTTDRERLLLAARSSIDALKRRR